MMDSVKFKKRANNTVKNELPSKKFKARNSMLTDLFENVHIRTIHNLAWVLVITSQLRRLLLNYITYGRFSLDLELFQISFSKPYPLLYIWVNIFLVALLPYFGFALWATIRHKIEKLSVPFFDRLSLVIFISYTATYTYYFSRLIQQTDFKPASGAALMCELVRLKMKNYAFVRSNVPRTLKFKYHDKDEILYPSISQYMYFLFAPTLIYQDEYPRSKSIQWKKVAEHFLNFAGTLLLINIIIQNFLGQLEMFTQNTFTWTNFLVLVIEFAPISGIIMLTIFYLFFHCWSNAFAEMLKFSDRSFYQDFWTSRAFERYYRTWSGIVYDWLYVYIYKDFYEIVWPDNKFVARAMVFFISALYHEFILAITFNTFSPYLFVVFFSNSLIVKKFYFNNRIGNLFFLLCSAIGFSILVCGYTTQYYYDKMQ